MTGSDKSKLRWRWRDTVGVLAILLWAVAWTAFAATQLATGAFMERRTALDLFCLSIGLAGLYVAVGVTVVRVGEIVRSDRDVDSRRAE
jgi:hypothetical protein